MNNIYCSMIHGGLQIDFRKESLLAKHCCLRTDFFSVDKEKSVWDRQEFVPLREKNLLNEWDPGCSNCHRLEKSGLTSFRQGMNYGLGTNGKTDLSGPARMDITFDISCNLACRTCGTHSSTFWQKHLKEHNEWNKPIFFPRSKHEIIDILSKLNLENLKQVVFCGGETLLGNKYWDIADWLADNVPNAKQQLIISFQTNGTQPIHPKNFSTIEKLHLVKLHVSVDGVGSQFEYLRWPASWNQVQENLFELRETVPSNVMFLIEQTISIFNVANIECVDKWVVEKFSTNREGDHVDCTKHLAGGTFSLEGATYELVELLQEKNTKHLVSTNWKEIPTRVESVIREIKKFDQYRTQSFWETFPETAPAFRRYW